MLKTPVGPTPAGPPLPGLHVAAATAARPQDAIVAVETPGTRQVAIGLGPPFALEVGRLASAAVVVRPPKTGPRLYATAIPVAVEPARRPGAGVGPPPGLYAASHAPREPPALRPLAGQGPQAVPTRAPMASPARPDLVDHAPRTAPPLDGLVVTVATTGVAEARALRPAPATGPLTRVVAVAAAPVFPSKGTRQGGVPVAAPGTPPVKGGL